MSRANICANLGVVDLCGSRRIVMKAFGGPYEYDMVRMSMTRLGARFK